MSMEIDSNYERSKIMYNANNTYNASNESYMTVKEFCERLQVSTSTAYRMIKEQQISAVKFGRRLYVA